MTAIIIDGKAVAAKLREKIAAETARLKSAHGLKPGLATVLVGNDPASEVYVRNKGKTAEALGFKSVHVALPADTTQRNPARQGARIVRRQIRARHTGAVAAAQASATKPQCSTRSIPPRMSTR